MRFNFKTSVAASVCLAALMVGGCGNKDKGQGALKSSEAQALNLSRADASTFAPYFRVGDCAADEMEALGALAGLGIGETGTDGLTYASRSFADGVVTYSDFRTTDGNDVMSAGSVKIYCPAMTDAGDPTFARVDVSDLDVTGDEGKVSVETLSLADFSPEMAQILAENLVEFGADMDSDNLSGIGAMTLSGLSFDVDEMKGSIEGMAYGMNEETEKADAMIDAVEMSFADVDDTSNEPAVFKLAGMSMRNFKMTGMSASDDPAEAMREALQQMNFIDKPYDSFVMDDMSLTSPWIDMTFDGIEGVATEKGDKITIRQVTEPMRISLKPKLGENAEAAQFYNQFKALGFEQMEFSSSSTTLIDKGADTVTLEDGLFVMEDGFRMNFEYAAEGLAAMVAKADAAQTAGVEPDFESLMSSLKLQSMRFSLEDKSIVERGMKLATEMTGQSESALKRNLSMLTMGAAMMGQNDVQSEVYGETAGALVEWIKEGGTLTIEAAPKAPIQIGPLVTGLGEGVDADSLGFSARRDP
jgi:hypothetical protein